MSSLSPIAQNPTVSNLANLILAASFPKLSVSPSQMQSVNLNHLSGNVALPSELDQAAQGIGMAPVSVKPQHLNYLRDFRTQQCPLFANHKCTQHKPFTCFHWHFPNQRRRRPLRKADGTFSYSPDVYCDKYDETRGECPNGDACPYLHRNAGDTERRYHLRYFKTGTCIHDTDARGQCSRNGAHCAFAHGAHDLRVPVYDIREVQEATECPVNLPASLEKERVLSEDPKWNDMAYVLANYKTEQCRKPPRMCRQGYACPFFHNTKDKRRGPLFYKYRSTPCPSVKSSDEWLDSSLCEQSDDCPYCHTRTEQQFHPEIYKSTKCNDVVQQNYCPRGPFCAFAHEESEMNFGRNFMQLESAAAVGAAGGGGAGGGAGIFGVGGLPHLQHPSALSPLTLSRLVGPGAWEQHHHHHQTQQQQQHHLLMLQQAAVGGSPTAGQSKGRTFSGASAASVESGVGSIGIRDDSPVGAAAGTKFLPHQAAAAAVAAAAARASMSHSLAPGQMSSSAAMLPDLDDLDLSQPDASAAATATGSSDGNDSFSPLTVLTSISGPVGIPGAQRGGGGVGSPYSPGFNPLTYASANQADSRPAAGDDGASDEGTPGSLPFQGLFDAGPDSGGRHRLNSGGDRSSASSNYAQSPILMSHSPFSNPGMDLERLHYQQEVSRALEEATRMREAMQRVQRERDDAHKQLEAVRAKLRDISSIAEHSPKDLSRCTPEELEELKQKLQKHLLSVQQLTTVDDSTAFPTSAGAAVSGLNLSASADSLGFSAALSTVEEASGDATPNVGAVSESASLNSSVNCNRLGAFAAAAKNKEAKEEEEATKEPEGQEAAAAPEGWAIDN